MLRPSKLLSGFTLASLLSTTASAHSWIEQMQIIGPNGSYAGNAGYPRGYLARTNPGFDGYSDKWQLPSPDTALDRTRINASDFLCHPAQRTANYTSQYPRLQVAPDSYVALRYMENGHVTQPWIPLGKPAGSGTVFVYGTYTPSADEKILDVLQWTTNGTGGNGKGSLLTAQNFDDGRCHQPNSSPLSVQRQMEYPDGVPGQESWCETDLHIPANSTAGATLTLYWVWSWQTQPGTEGAPCGKDEYYTTCADVDIASGAAANARQALAQAPPTHTLVQQDPRPQAVSDYLSRTADAPTPDVVTDESCSATSVTSSSWPASLTQFTSLPADFLATATDHPVSSDAVVSYSSFSSDAAASYNPVPGSIAMSYNPAPSNTATSYDPMPSSSSSSSSSSNSAAPSTPADLCTAIQTTTLTETITVMPTPAAAIVTPSAAYESYAPLPSSSPSPSTSAPASPSPSPSAANTNEMRDANRHKRRHGHGLGIRRGRGLAMAR